MAAVLMVCGGAAGTAHAAAFDASGRLVLDGEFGFGFDSGEALPDGLALSLYDLEMNPVDAAPRFVADELGLEGSGALHFGGDAWAGTLSLGSLGESFAGRRVELRIWQRPEGTDAEIRLRYTVGGLIGGGDSYTMGSVLFVPTGRATSDGWIEYSSGPLDFELGARLAPRDLLLVDRHITAAYSNWQIEPSPTARVRIDGLEILDLGAAAVPDAACTVLDEDAVCGELGVCYHGRCADAQATLGAVPDDAQVRADYVARRTFEMRAFNGVRAGQAADSGFVEGMQAALEGPRKDFWPDISHAYERLRDGHGSAPIINYDRVPVRSGMCVYLGEADLLPGGGVAPLVFHALGGKATSENLLPGDVLVAIDDVPVAQWRLAAGRFFSYTGDPLSRDALLMPEVIEAALRTGARLEFARCSRGDGVACTEAEVQTLEVDFGAAIGEVLYAGQLPENWSRGLGCDFRFLDTVPGAGTDDYEYAASRVEDDVQIVQFNGFPSYYWQGGQAWFSVMDDALGAGQSRILLDQRRGDGGTFDAVVRLTDHLMSLDDQVVTELYPWLEQEATDSETGALRACLQSDAYTCGNFYRQTMPQQPFGAAASSARVAMLFGRDVSGNDYFSRAMQFRSGRTRSFGSTHTWGAFGFSCPLPSLIGEVIGGNYQCTDSIFYQGAPPSADALVWESGTGVAPDVVVYQKQSDAVNGVDTVVEAAMSWLEVLP